MHRKESEKVEFKKSTSELKEAVISMVSMLNKHNEGTVYFGVKNDGSIFGQQIGKDTTNDISKAIKTYIKPRIVPEIEVLEMKEKQIIKVSVCGEDLPYSAYDRYYVRSDDEDLAMTGAQLKKYFIGQNYDYSKWEKESSGANIDSVDEELLISYIDEANDCGRLNFRYKDVETTLKKLKLLKGDKLNNAGYYLFSKDKPLLLKLAMYPTEERVYFSDIKQFRGNIFECIEEAVKYVTNNIHWRADIVGMKRVETPEIPLEALREVVVNSFAHMNVEMNEMSANEIYITPSRVHIYNPGPLVPGTDPDMFAKGEQGPMIRNPLIATTLYYNDTIDAFGTGFERVFKLCGKDFYKYNSNQFGFAFDFLRKNNEPSSIKEEADYGFDIKDPKNNFTKDEIKLYELLNEGVHYTKTDLAKKMKKSESTVQRIVKRLIDRGAVRRVGSNKTGWWEAINE